MVVTPSTWQTVELRTDEIEMLVASLSCTERTARRVGPDGAQTAEGDTLLRIHQIRVKLIMALSAVNRG